MFKRPLAYLLLAGFAAVMVILLMLDDPAAQEARVTELGATLQAAQALVLFPQLSDPRQITGLEVVDVAQRTGILLLRAGDGRWMAPATAEQPEIAADALDQSAAEQAALALVVMVAQQSYEASEADFAIFGFRPDPSYRFRFRAREASGQAVESVVLEIGDANPDHMAYYVWPQGDRRIYLIDQQMVRPLLDLVTGSVQVTPEAGASSADAAESTSVP